MVQSVLPDFVDDFQKCVICEEEAVFFCMTCGAGLCSKCVIETLDGLKGCPTCSEVEEQENSQMDLYVEEKEEDSDA